MTLSIQPILSAQYGAALAMLRAAVTSADPATWRAFVGQFPFWHVAYHTLYTTDMYLSRDEGAFTPQPFHREHYDRLGPVAWAPPSKVVADQPYAQDLMAAYVDTCAAKARLEVEAETEATLAGPSGFHWLRFTRLEAHVYNLRHVQHHTGQLAAALRRQGLAGVEWVGALPL
jgi:hypothetical protein